MTSKIMMLRHGITQGNKNKWFYGGLDLPLIEEGKEALVKLRDSGAYPKVPENAKFITTGMTRTEETLEILFGSHPHDIIADLREMEFGECEGKSFDELKDEPAFRSWTYDETGTVSFPGGESRNEFTGRVSRGLKTLLESHREKEKEATHTGKEAFSVLICHGGVIASLMYELFPRERSDMWQWMTEPGGGYVVEMGQEGPIGFEQIGGITDNYSE